MRTRRYSLGMRVLAWTGMLSIGGLELCQAPCQAMSIHLHRPRPYHVSELKPGLTQTPDAALLKKIEAKRKAASKRPDVRALSILEMKSLRGRGPYRYRYYAGTFPWHRSFRNANLCNGDLSLSYTDIQVAPAKGAGLALQRTYNSQDDRIGPFGLGWTHAYDIRTEEESDLTDGMANLVDRQDFFGGRQRYHRDADGLYTPPPYLYDQFSSQYAAFLVNGPPNVLADTDIGMDGTAKHYFQNGSERDCDTITDRYGNVTTLFYTLDDGTGTGRKLLTSVQDPSGRTLDFQWTNFTSGTQPTWRITQVNGENGLAYMVTYQYYTDPNDPNSLYNLQSVTLDAGEGGLKRTTSYTYTSATANGSTEYGLLASVTDPLGHTLSYNYSISPLTNSAWVSWIQEPAGIDPITGDPRSATWTISFNYEQPNLFYTTLTNVDTGLSIDLMVDGWLRTVGYDLPLWSIWQWSRSYDTANNVISTSEVYGLTPAPTKTDNFTYGPHGNMLTHSITGFSGTDQYKNYDGDKYFQKQYDEDANGHQTTYIVGDDQGNDPDGIVPQSNGNKGSILHVRDAGYSDPNSPSYGKEYTYYYNQYGQKIKEINLNGVETDYTYGDQWGNLTQVVQDPGTGHLNKTTTMTYDINGRVQTSIDANGNASQNPSAYQCVFTYNDLGQPLTASFPATANTPAETISYIYDNNGRTSSVSDNRGTTTINYEAGCDRVSNVSDPVTGKVSYTYGITGERLSMSLPGSQTPFTYNYGDQNNFTPMIPKDDPNALCHMPVYILDDNNNRVDYRSTDPGITSYAGFDVSGHLYAVQSNETYNVSSGQLVSYQESDYTYEYSTASHIEYSGRLANLTTTFYQPNSQTNPQTLLLKDDHTTQEGNNQVGNYDNAGNLLSHTFTYSDNSTRTENYAYDDLNRLSTVNYGDGQNQSYTFDAMGNRLSKSDSVNGSESYGYNNANMLQSRGSNSYTNDANGNTLTGGGRNNVWDSQNRLASCVNGSNTCSYTYGPDGMRHQSVVNGVTTDFVLDQTMFVRELQNGSSIATYLTGVRGPEYRRDDTIPGGTLRWYVYDGLGSVVEEVDPSGNITASRKYDVYGSVRSNTGTSTSKHRFVGSLGHPSEDEIGLVYMQARYMDPVTGRFVSEDPAENGFNWFNYCNNNPVNFADPNGKDGVGLAGLIGAINFLSFLELLCQLYGSYRTAEALNKFMAILKNNKDALAVENAWGDFMQTWSFWNDPSNSFGSDIAGAIMSAITILSSYTGMSSMLINGSVIGFNLAVMCIGYALRLEFYVQSIDDD